MNQVAKLIMVDNNDKYLMMYRSDHPVFGHDPDLPGGTLEIGESPVQTMLREVEEEAGITLDETLVSQLFSGTDYSEHRTEYILYIAVLDKRPTVTISWEHASYEWVDKERFLAAAKNANDTYMHMVHDVLTRKLTKQ